MAEPGGKGEQMYLDFLSLHPRQILDCHRMLNHINWLQLYTPRSRIYFGFIYFQAETAYLSIINKAKHIYPNMMPISVSVQTTL